MKNERNRALSSQAALAVILALSVFAVGAAPAGKQRTFATPKEAADALVSAASAGDAEALIAIFGPGGKDIVSSGDPVQDKNDIARFAERGREKTDAAVDPKDPKHATVTVGKDDWPLPVPLVQNAGKWRYDAKAAREEILNRRIGSNELRAIEFLRGYVDAQKEYASETHDDSKIHQYAQKAISTAGKHDGLSWWTDDHKPAGPIGDEVAKALAAGYTKSSAPYNGYYFRILTAQGPSAPRGERNYVVRGMMIGGFAALAYPATYGVSGVQTFQVSHDGIVYEKDLGPDTAKIAPAIKQYDPDKTWKVSEDMK